MQLSDWVTSTDIAGWVDDATETLLGTVGDFTDDDPRWIGPYLPIVNPPIWELTHVGWFAEAFVLRRLHGRRSLLDDVDARFDSGDVAHRSRWDLANLSPREAKDYVRRVGDDMIAVLANNEGLDSTDHYVAYAISHHDAHCEALTYTRQTHGWGALETATAPFDNGAAETTTVAGDRTVDGGRLVQGASRSQPLVMDNEKWAHVVHVEPFSMAMAPVTVAEFAAFVDADGYRTDALWDAEGLAWRNQAGATTPVYWRQGSDGWQRRVNASWFPIEHTADHPMVYVSWHEANAWCRWAGRRLPTESEWEMAATTPPSGQRQPWFPWGNRDPFPNESALDGNTGGTVPVGAFAAGDGPWGHRQLIGNVWEWTSSTFGPYPHFEPDAYDQNSAPWFGTRKVLRGGSWATRNRYVRSTFRNFFTPDRRDVLAGFRTCAIA